MTSAVDELFGERKLSRQSLRDQSVEILREAIIRGVIGPGSRINEAELAEKLGISRGPLREAIQRVGAEGLVEFRRNRGAFVREVALEDVRLIYEVREALEGAAARRVARVASDSEIAGLKRQLVEVDNLIRSHEGATEPDASPSMLETAHAFHVTILQLCGNPYLERYSNDLHVQLRVARLQSDQTVERARQVLKEHRAIVTAIAKRDAAAAAAAMSKHLANSMGRFETAQVDK
jgi:DNA-binding GntR family transcriptional regulator